MHIAWSKESHRDEKQWKYHHNGNVEKKSEVVAKPALSFIGDGQNHSHHQNYIPTDEHFSYKSVGDWCSKKEDELYDSNICSLAGSKPASPRRSREKLHALLKVSITNENVNRSPMTRHGIISFPEPKKEKKKLNKETTNLLVSLSLDLTTILTDFDNRQFVCEVCCYSHMTIWASLILSLCLQSLRLLYNNNNNRTKKSLWVQYESPFAKINRNC